MIAFVTRIVGRGFSFLNSFLQSFQVKQVLTVAVVGMLILGTNMAPDRGPNSLSEKVQDRVDEANQRSERPKTTGEFLDEAQGDIPLDERIHNITRDSAEAFRDFGKGYGDAIKDSTQMLKGKVEQAGDKLSNNLR